MRKAVFTLEPFGCPSCVKKIEGTLSRLDGVKEVKVMFHSGRVRTQFDEDRIQIDQIQETLTKLGYPVLSQKVS